MQIQTAKTATKPQPVMPPAPCCHPGTAPFAPYPGSMYAARSRIASQAASGMTAANDSTGSGTKGLGLLHGRLWGDARGRRPVMARRLFSAAGLRSSVSRRSYRLVLNQARRIARNCRGAAAWPYRELQIMGSNARYRG